MGRASPLDDDDLRRARATAQLLHRSGRRSVVALVSHLTGVQAQVLPAARLALRARRAGLTAASVDRARTEDRSIVLCWAMRGTLHLIAAEDHAWLVPLVIERRVAHARRRLLQEGVQADQATRGVRAIRRMLEREAPLTRTEIAEGLRRLRIRTEGQAIAHLVWLAAASGAICHGPDRAGGPGFVLTRDWLRSPMPMERDAALRETTVRFLRAHGPATPADLAAWSGMSLADSRRGWRSIEDRLVEVTTTRGPMWILRSASRATTGSVVRLLPAFDEFLLGWQDRSLIADARGWKMIQRGGGWLHPVVLADGRAEGTWSSERSADVLHVDLRLFGTSSTTLHRSVGLEARDIGRFLGVPTEIRYPKRSAR